MNYLILAPWDLSLPQEGYFEKTRNGWLWGCGEAINEWSLWAVIETQDIYPNSYTGVISFNKGEVLFSGNKADAETVIFNSLDRQNRRYIDEISNKIEIL